MDVLSTDLSPAEPLERSTQLDEGRPTSEGSPSKAPTEDKAEKPSPVSRMDAIKRAAEDVEKAAPQTEKKADDAVADAKAKSEDNPALADTKKAISDSLDREKDEAAEAEKARRPSDKDKWTSQQWEDYRNERKLSREQGWTDEAVRRHAGGRQPIEAPERFMPRSKELWQNVPHEVRADLQRVMKEDADELTQARESVREFEAVRPYAEMARQSGTTIDQALGRYVQMEQALRADPSQGFRALLHNMELGPVQAIGHILAAFNVRPEQLAQHIAQSPNEYTALARPQPQQQVQPQNGEVESLKQQLAQMQANMAHRDAHANIIAPFAAENPRFYELQDTIAGFLESAIIPQSLSPHDRLAAAYDMAVRISPSFKEPPASAQTERADDKTDSRAGEDFGGTKSVRGAPASGMDTSSRRRGKMSRGDALTAAFADLGIPN